MEYAAQRATDLDETLIEAYVLLGESMVEKGKSEELSATMMNKGVKFLKKAVELSNRPELYSL